MILGKLQDPTTKLFLLFLEFILPVFNSLNKSMQSEKPQIHRIDFEVKRAFKLILECYMNEDYTRTTELDAISPSDPRYFADINSLYLGANVGGLMEEITIGSEAKKFFQLRCLDFLIEAALQIKKRFAFNDPTLKHLQVLSPDVVKSRKVTTIAPLIKRFDYIVPSSDTQEIDSQWRILRNTDVIISSNENDIVSF